MQSVFNRCILLLQLALACSIPIHICQRNPLWGAIYEWEYVNLNDPSLGRKESTTLLPGTEGKVPEPGIHLGSLNLKMAYLSGKDLSSAYFRFSDLTNADLSNSILSHAQFGGAILVDTIMTDAEVRGASLIDSTRNGLTSSQLYSTASYKAGDLSGIQLFFNDMSGWDFSGLNLTEAKLQDSTLLGANFSDAIITGASLHSTTSSGFTAQQLYSTESYKQRDLNNSSLGGNDLSSWDFSGQDLRGVGLDNSILTNANLSGAIIERVSLYGATYRGFTSGQFYSTASYQLRDLRGLGLGANDIRGWDLSGQDLSGASFSRTVVNNTDFSDAQIQDAEFSFATENGFTEYQLYSTASYKAKDLSGVFFNTNDLSGWDFSSQNLRDATFFEVDLHGTDFTDADIRGAILEDASSLGLTASQVYSTKSYKEQDLLGVAFSRNSLIGWDLQGFNLSGIICSGCNMRDANLSGANLSNAHLYGVDVIGADFYGSDLSFADLRGAKNLGAANINGAKIHGADLSFTRITSSGFTFEQLYSTKSYQEKDLSGIELEGNELSGIDLSGQDLTGASFKSARLGSAILTDAIIEKVDLTETTQRGLTKDQFYTTKTYQKKNLSGIVFDDNRFALWDFRGQNLTNSSFFNVYYDRTDFEAADLRGALHLDLTLFNLHSYTNNTIYPDGSINSLDLSAGDILVIRDYDGNPDGASGPMPPLAITVQDSFMMAPTSALAFRFESDEWNSTISFVSGIPVDLGGGTLELDFNEDVNIASQIGRTLQLFDWTGVSPTGLFNVASPSKFIWDLTNLYTSGEITLQSVTLLPGDFDGDGDVDGRDLLALQRDPNLGSLVAWKANYGSSLVSPSEFVAIPEPASGFMLMVLLTTLATRRVAIMSSRAPLGSASAL